MSWKLTDVEFSNHDDIRATLTWSGLETPVGDEVAEAFFRRVLEAVGPQVVEKVYRLAIRSE